MKKSFILLLGGLLLCGHSVAQTADHEAIMQLCYEESMAYHARDFEKWATYHVQSTEADLAYNNPDGSFGYDTGWEKLSAGMKEWLRTAEKEDMKITNSNFNFTIQGDMAFVSYDSDNLNAQGKTMRIREYRTLLRIDGQWKVLTIQVYANHLSGK
jgi:hypothetical protein